MILPKHCCSLTIEHNPHKNYYESIPEYVSGPNNFSSHFKNDEAYDRCIDTNELWVMQWYPDTPVGFIAVCAPTLNELIEYALEVEKL
jgi:hypothetical protein